MAKPTSTPPEPGWADYPCRECGTLVRVAETYRSPQCEECRDREIASWYASGRYMGD